MNQAKSLSTSPLHTRNGRVNSTASARFARSAKRSTHLRGISSTAGSSSLAKSSPFCSLTYIIVAAPRWRQSQPARSTSIRPQIPPRRAVRIELISGCSFNTCLCLFLCVDEGWTGSSIFPVQDKNESFLSRSCPPSLAPGQGHQVCPPQTRTDDSRLGHRTGDRSRFCRGRPGTDADGRVHSLT